MASWAKIRKLVASDYLASGAVELLGLNISPDEPDRPPEPGHQTIVGYEAELFLLLARRDPKSEWYEYAQSFPEDQAGEMARIEAEMASVRRLLKGSSYNDAISGRLEQMSSGFQNLTARLTVEPAVSESEWAWAERMAGSRVWEVTMEGVQHKALIPVADLLLHDENRNVVMRHDESLDMLGPHVARLVTVRDVLADEPLTDTYGLGRTNLDFYLAYGCRQLSVPAHPVGAGSQPPKSATGATRPF